MSEPDRGRWCWKGKPLARAAVYGNQRRIQGARGKRLLRQRGERLERPNAHLYETGGMRRVYLRGHINIRKRLLVQACRFNLGFLMRNVTSVWTPRSLQDRVGALVAALIAALNGFWRFVGGLRPAISLGSPDPARIRGTTWLHQLRPVVLPRRHSGCGLLGEV